MSAEDGATAMEEGVNCKEVMVGDLVVTGLGPEADTARSDSPEQTISTPSHEYQSGFKRLRTGWEDGRGGSEPSELAGPSASEEEVEELQAATKDACSELGSVIIALRRERRAPVTPSRPLNLNHPDAFRTRG
jgi:hypothetical protein